LLAETAGVGLNTRCPVMEEIDLQVPIPWSLSVLLRHLVPPSELGRLVLLSRHLEPAEAQALGLVNEVASFAGFEGRCRERLEELSAQGPAAGLSKRFVREPALAEMRDPEGAKLQRFLDGWFSAPAQEQLRSISAAL
jgi:enoyl-CoA hydratase/carnithine racemase